MSIDLGYRPDPAPPAEFPVSVIMSWEHAKTLQRLVNAAVKSYEEEVGPIREFEGKIGPARPAGQIGFDQGEEQ
jgi:hypothetical protein